MSSIKCPNCNLVSFADAAFCQRCGTQLGAEVAFVAQRTYQGSAEQRAPTYIYDTPPPPSFYTNGTSTGAQAVSCMKCGTEDGVKFKTLTKERVPPVAFFALLLGFLPGLIIILIAKAKHRLEIPFCEPCYSTFRFVSLVDAVTSLFCLIGLIAAVVTAVVYESWIVFGLAMTTVIGGVVLGRYYCHRFDLKFKKLTTREVIVTDPRRGEVRLV